MNKIISVAAILALTAARTPFIKHKPLHDLPTNVADDELYGLLQPKFVNPIINKVYHDDEQMTIRIDPRELRPHYRTFAPLSADDDEFFVDFAHDDEQMIRIDPREPRLHRPTFSPLVAADDEFFVDNAHDDEQMIWKYDPTRPRPTGPFPPIYADDADDELFADFAQDDEQMLIWKPDMIPRPHPTGPFPPIYADDAEDEFFVDNAHDDEQMIWKYDPTRPRPTGPIYALDAEDEFFVDNAHDDEQMIWKYDPNRLPHYPPLAYADDEFFVDNAHDDEQLIRIDPREFHTRPTGPIYALDAEDEFFVDNAHDDEQMIWKYDPRLQPLAYADDAEDEFFAADDELFNVEKAEGKIHEGIKKAKDYIAKHPEAVKQAQKDVKNLAGILKKLAQDQKKGIQNDELPTLSGLIKEGRKVYNEVKAQRTQKKPEVHDNALFLDEVQDNDLSIKDKLKGAANWVGDHPKVISETAKAVKILRGGR